MASEELSILELEDAANRVRARLGVTLDRLRHNLTPAHLLDEWADSSGLKEMTPEKIFKFAARRHPVPTILIGASLGFLAYSVASRTKTNSRELDLTICSPKFRGLGRLVRSSRLLLNSCWSPRCKLCFANPPNDKPQGSPGYRARPAEQYHCS
jgi:hypothetical protein